MQITLASRSAFLRRPASLWSVVALALAVILTATSCSNGSSSPADADADLSDGDVDEAVVELTEPIEENGAEAEAEADVEVEPELTWRFFDGGVQQILGDHLAVLTLKPVVRINDQWVGVGEEGCTPAQDGEPLVTCTLAGGIHQVVVELSGDGTLRSTYNYSDDFGHVQAISLEGTLYLPGATSWLSNGFQSWSQSGVIALGAPPTETALAKALSLRGDTEVLRQGKELSWWYSFAGGNGPVIVAGAATAERFKSWVQFSRPADAAPDTLAVRLVSGGAGESLPSPSVPEPSSEAWFIALGPDAASLEGLLTRYGTRIDSRRSAKPAAADAGWNSWYELWTGVAGTDVAPNARLAKDILTPYLKEGQKLRIVIDDGWQKAWGVWEPNDKFPDGMDAAVAALKAEGFEVGVWLAPLMVRQDSDLAVAHPEWFMENAVFGTVGGAPNYILDVTNPGAAAHLTEVIERIVGWGFDFLKIDFLFGGTYEGGRDGDVTGMQAYQQALSLIRKAAGEDVLLLAVGAPPIPSFPYVDSWRLGGDIALSTGYPDFIFIASQARSVAAHWPLCLATLCDADPVLLRTLAREEVDTGAWVVALAGGALFLSDDLRLLPEERRNWGLDELRVSTALSGLPSIPEDPFPASPPEYLTNAIMDAVTGHHTHVIPFAWKLPGDAGRVFINWSEEGPLTVEGVTIPSRATRVLPTR